MPRYWIRTQEPEGGRYSDEYCWGFYEADTRGKAHAKFMREHKYHTVEWLTPVTIRKLRECSVCRNTGYTDNDEQVICPNCEGRCIDPDGFDKDAHEEWVKSLA